MNRFVHLPLWSGCAALAGALLFPLSPVARAEFGILTLTPATAVVEEDAGLPPEVALERQERRVDREHFLKIRAAIEAWRKDHQGELPNWLSDLVPQYLADTNLLVSPTHLRTGQVGPYFVPDPKLTTSYNFEFNSTPSSRFNELAGDNIPTMQRWKFKQMEYYGDAVPIVRHLWNNRALNLTYGGDIYETQIAWETDTNTFARMKQLRAEGKLKPLTIDKTLAVQLLEGRGSDPVTNATVEAEIDTEVGWLPLEVAPADAEGKCRIDIPKLKVKTLNITVSGEDYLRRRMSVSLASGETPPTPVMRLTKGQTFEGWVRSDDGKPLVGATAALATTPFTARSDSSGHWTIRGIPAGYPVSQIQISHPDYRSATVNLSQGKEPVKLSPRPSIRCAVREGDARTPVSNFSVLLGEGAARGVRWNEQRVLRGGGGEFLWKYDEEPPAFLRFEAPGCEPAEVRFEAVRASTAPWPVALKKAAPLQGRVTLSGGAPAAKAQLLAITEFSEASLGGGKIQGQPRQLGESGADGSFSLPADPRTVVILATHPQGWAEVPITQFRRDGALTLQPWKELKGELRFSVKPHPPGLVLLTRDFALPQAFQGLRQARVDLDFSAYVQDGLSAGDPYVFEFVPTGKAVLWKACVLEPDASYGGETTSFVGQWVSTDAKRDAAVENEGTWRLSGRLASPEALPGPWPLLGIARATTTTGQTELAFTVGDDGRVCVDGLPNQTSQLEIDLYRPPIQVAAIRVSALDDWQKRAAQNRGSVSVSSLKWTPVAPAQAGQEAPAFEVVGLGTDSAPADKWDLGKFKGKYLLVDFWASWSQPDFASATPLRELQRKFGTRANFALLSLNLDENPAVARQTIERCGMRWAQGHAGAWWRSGLLARYGAQSVPAACLIGPDGKVLETNIPGERLAATVEKYLKP